MSTARSIGRLFIDLEARTAKLETDMAKARTIVRGATAAIQEQGTATEKLRNYTNVHLHQLTQRLAGMLAVFTFIKNEVKYVYENIEKIPGIPGDTLGSILQMKSSLADAREQLHQLTAAAIAGFSTFGTAVGVGLAQAFGYGEMPNAHDELALDVARKNLENATSISQARKRLRDMERQAELADLTEGARITALREQAAAAQRVASGGMQGDTLAVLEARITAFERTRDANQRFLNLQEQNAKAEQRWQTALDQSNESLASRSERVDLLRSKLEKLQALLPNRYVVDGVDAVTGFATMRRLSNKEMSPEDLALEADILNRMTGVQLRLNSALRANGEMARELGNALSKGFGQAILSGEKLRDVLRNLLGDLLQIILQRTVLSPLADFFTGGLLRIPGVAGRAAGGPLGAATVVGEYGPELLLGGGYGTIVPNEQLRGGARTGNTYMIDARGTDAGVVARLETLLLQLAGPGVVERRSVSAVQSAKWRGQLSFA